MSLISTSLGGAAVIALVAATPALAQSGGGDRGNGRVVIAPYIEAAQTLDVDLNGGDAVTYTSLAAGIDLSADTARASAQLSYRYERRISWDGDIGDDDVHSGLARATFRLAPGIGFEAGALATRSRSDIRGAAPGLLLGNSDNISQIYSLYAGPSLSKQVGVVDVSAAYQLGFTKVETPYEGGIATTTPRLDYFDHSWSHVATASAGFAPGTLLPVGLTASAGFAREDGSQLKQRFEDAYGRVDALAPISATVALAGGVGYEKLTTSQRDPLRDALGAPVLDGNGRFVTDPASPRRIAYRTDGVYYDAGVVWRPNRRISVSANVGRRYGTMSYTGNVSYTGGHGVALSANVYDAVQTFGGQLQDNIASLPTSFITARDAYSQQLNGCVFSTGGSSAGGCLNSVLQSITTASYRTRGIDAVLSARRGQSLYGAGLGYSNRKLFAPNSGSGIVVYGTEDESYYGQLFYGRTLSPVSGLEANAFVNYYESGLAGADGTWSYGTTGSYYHSFGRLSTTATLGLYSFKVGDFDSDWSAQAQLAARYTF